jgi:hypothetical protein
MLLANFATLATALFTGAAVYITLVEHLARLQCPTAHAAILRLQAILLPVRTLVLSGGH